MTKFEKVKEEIAKIITRSPLEEDPVHSIKTWEWVLKLKPNTDEALQIAALAHDIDRAITGTTETHGLKDISDQKIYRKFKKDHSVRSAKFIAEILEKHGYEKESIDRVKFLVENHEFGGSPDSDILMSADSIAYFDYNVDFYLKNNGPKKTKDKIRFMLQRVNNPEVKKIILKISHQNPEVDKIFKEVAGEL